MKTMTTTTTTPPAPRSDHPLLSLRLRLAALVLVVVAPILVLMLVTHGKYRQHEIDHAGADALELARVASEHHDRLIDGARQLLAGLTRLPEVRDGDLQRCEAIFSEIERDNPGYGLIMSMAADGRIAAPSLVAGGNVADQSWFETLRDTRGFSVGGYQWCPVSKDMVLIRLLEAKTPVTKAGKARKRKDQKEQDEFCRDWGIPKVTTPFEALLAVGEGINI